MPKTEILDPQGKAIAAALNRLGHSGIDSVRVGKRFELNLSETYDEAMQAQLKTIAAEMLSNSVIEDVVAIRLLSETATA